MVDAKPKLRNGIAGQLQRNKDRRHGIGKNQYTVLGNLGIGNTFHAAENGIDEDDSHTDEQAGFKGKLKKTGKGNADTLHLADNIGQRSGDQAENGNHPGTFLNNNGHR